MVGCWFWLQKVVDPVRMLETEQKAAYPRLVITFHVFRFFPFARARADVYYYSGATLPPLRTPFERLWYRYLVRETTKTATTSYSRFRVETAEIRMHKCISAPTSVEATSNVGRPLYPFPLLLHRFNFFFFSSFIFLLSFSSTIFSIPSGRKNQIPFDLG